MLGSVVVRLLVPAPKLLAAAQDEIVAVPRAREVVPVQVPPVGAPTEERDAVRDVRVASVGGEGVLHEFLREFVPKLQEKLFVLLADRPAILVGSSGEHLVAIDPLFVLVEEADGLVTTVFDLEQNPNFLMGAHAALLS